MARFKPGSYGWRSTALATRRLREAVSEIKKVAKTEPIVAGDGVVSLTACLWPSLEHIDSSSGALGNAVYRTLQESLPILISAPADLAIRAAWLDRLYDAVIDDGVSFLAPVEDAWGETALWNLRTDGRMTWFQRYGIVGHSPASLR